MKARTTGGAGPAARAQHAGDGGIDINAVSHNRGPLQYGTVPRALVSPFVAAWLHRHEDARRDAQHLRAEVVAALEHGRLYDLVPFAGQTVGLIREILPAAEIVRRIVAEAEAALQRAVKHIG